MGGGLMQLVAYGAQDIYLTGNPQITFFKVVYRRHTNFSMESIEQTWNGTSEGTMAAIKGGRPSATISRNGDLISKIYLEMAITGAGPGNSNTGATIIDNVSLEIGGQQIDKQYGHFMEVWSELTQPNYSGRRGRMVADTATQPGTKFQNLAAMGGSCSFSGTATAYIPLFFWFCRNPGLALPLIALQYHEVKLYLTFSGVTVTNLTSLTNKLYVDYIYLDTDERRRFAQVSHEYLIEQVQYQQTSGNSAELNFNHPVKELIWTGPYTSTTGARTALTVAATYLLKLNGHDRFSARGLTYFCQQQVYDYHTGTPVTSAATLTNGDGLATSHEIAVYSFALKPEEHQPSGTCNFSRIDNAHLVSTGAAQALNVYAINYNVLRIMSGMGGLAYSN